jgi:hypothetical protein
MQDPEGDLQPWFFKFCASTQKILNIFAGDPPDKAFHDWARLTTCTQTQRKGVSGTDVNPLWTVARLCSEALHMPAETFYVTEPGRRKYDLATACSLLQLAKHA